MSTLQPQELKHAYDVLTDNIYRDIALYTVLEEMHSAFCYTAGNFYRSQCYKRAASTGDVTSCM